MGAPNRWALLARTDPSRNMTQDGPSNNTLVYDAENRVLSATNGGASGSYSYDGNNLRVKKVSGSTTTVYIFSGAKVIAEYDNGAVPTAPSREYIYSGGALLAKIDSSGSTYYHPDHLSNRLTTDSSGNLLAQMGHYPFGDSWYNSTNEKLQFTSYERDSESGNDYAMARSYVNRLGRFSSPDPLSGSIGNPQSINRYSYALYDPVNLVDPSGLRPVYQPVLDSWTWLNWAFNVFANAAAGNLTVWDGTYYSLTSIVDDRVVTSWFPNYNPGLLGTILQGFNLFPPGIPGGAPPPLNLGPDPQPAKPQAPQNPTPNPNPTPQPQPKQSQCSSIQQDYNSAAMQSNAKWWTRFWGSVLLGGVAGGPLGAVAGGGVALLYDESRSEYNTLTQNATQQWNAAGCSGNLQPRFP